MIQNWLLSKFFADIFHENLVITILVEEYFDIEPNCYLNKAKNLRLIPSDSVRVKK